MDKMSPLIEKIRKSVKYIGSSVYINQRFKVALQQTQHDDNRQVDLDVDNKWNFNLSYASKCFRG